MEVLLSEDVLLLCSCHALTTENEEVMGLLLGDTEETKDNRLISKINSVSILTRSDKKKDRVEISPEQLSMASAEAEKISEQTGIRTRVIGWYHSHPHITVSPSHVDIQTQSMYQMLDKGFVGLIFSCFHKEPNKSGKIQVIAFQSQNFGKSSKQSTTDLIDLNEDAMQHDSTDSELRKKKSGIEAVEIPFRIVAPTATPKGSFNTFDKLVALQDILYSEENSAYTNSLQQFGSQNHPLAQMHSAAVYQKSLCRLLELETLPLLHMLQQRHQYNLEKIQQLKEEKQKLETRLKSKKAKNEMIALIYNLKG